MTDIRENRMGWFKSWRKRRACFHHNWRTGESWVDDRLVDFGRAKHFTCRECGRHFTCRECGRYWT